MARLSDLLFTPSCIGCAQFGEHLCQNCEQNLEPITSRKFAGFEAIAMASEYGGWLRESLIRYKNGQKQISPGLAKVLATTLLTAQFPRPLTLIPIPTTREKMAQRGFDSMHEILKSLEVDTSQYRIEFGQLQVRLGMLDQVGLSALERKRNLAGAFKSTSQIAGTVCVVDDVITTGATLNAASQALKVAGAQRVFGLAICGSKQWR
jgi:ComF family protein